MPSTSITTVFCDKARASEATGLSLDQLKTYRLEGLLRRGIHWVEINPRTVRFNLPLLLDWVATRANPAAHDAAIEAYLASLPSSRAVASATATPRSRRVA
jgi:hypothetical protein